MICRQMEENILHKSSVLFHFYAIPSVQTQPYSKWAKVQDDGQIYDKVLVQHQNWVQIHYSQEVKLPCLSEIKSDWMRLVTATKHPASHCRIFELYTLVGDQ